MQTRRLDLQTHLDQVLFVRQHLPLQLEQESGLLLRLLEQQIDVPRDLNCSIGERHRAFHRNARVDVVVFNLRSGAQQTQP